MKKGQKIPINLWATKPEGKMNDLPKLSFTMESCLFPMPEEEIGELTAKMKEFLRIVDRIGKTVPVHHQRAALERIGTSDERPKKKYFVRFF